MTVNQRTVKQGDKKNENAGSWLLALDANTIQAIDRRVRTYIRGAGRAPARPYHPPRGRWRDDPCRGQLLTGYVGFMARKMTPFFPKIEAIFRCGHGGG
jgi:hypothetical protein